MPERVYATVDWWPQPGRLADRGLIWDRCRVLDEWVLPRWAIGTVRTHLDAADLALAVLLFDRIVLPTPDNDAEFDRWQERGWSPGQLAGRVVHLGELVHLLPWEE